jgi:purine-nucleoside/S-methyl-5'-thioadenosine phosphorylase / adenosine deaminase
VKVARPFRWAGEHVAIELPGAQALFTTRRGGTSRGAYASLNLGRWTDDDPDAVEQNRKLLETKLGVLFAYGRQVHGATVARVRERPVDGFPAVRADGQATNLPGVGVLVLTADCLPLAITARGAAAMLHAGWRGLEAGVIAEGVRALRELGGEGPIAAAIGPGAGICCYEVGEEIHARFAAYGRGVRRGRNLDLKALARIQLERAGVEQIHDTGICTICTKRFYSHRREHGLTGRQAGIAWLT